VENKAAIGCNARKTNKQHLYLINPDVSQKSDSVTFLIKVFRGFTLLNSLVQSQTLVRYRGNVPEDLCLRKRYNFIARKREHAAVCCLRTFVAEAHVRRQCSYSAVNDNLMPFILPL
jgi:hypothetical protein